MQSRPTLTLLAGVLWMGFAVADPIELRSTDGQTVVTYRGIQFQQIDARHSRYLLTRGVVAKFKKTSVTISSDRATILALTEGNQAELTSVNAIGNAKLVKIDHRAKGIVTSTLTSSEVDYLNGKSGSSAACKSRVVLTQVDQGKHLTLRASGGSGNATFLSGVEAKNNRLTSATFHSPVVIDLNQAPVDGKKATQAHITCSEMVYRPSPTSGTLELSGNIRMVGNQGVLSNLSHATMHLNEKNELQNFEGSSGT